MAETDSMMPRPVPVTRIVSTESAIDAVEWPGDLIVMRTAPDEVLLVAGAEGTAPPGPVGPSIAAADQHAIVADDAGWSGLWAPADVADAALDATCAWPRPSLRPAFAQGMVAHLPVKLWLEEERTLFLMPHVVAVDFAHALGQAAGTIR